LRYCLNSRLCYLTRVIDDIGADAIEIFDGAIDKAIESIAEYAPPQDADRRSFIAVLRSLPLHLGGLGVVRHSWVQGDAGRLKSRKATLSFLEFYYGNSPLLKDTVSAIQDFAEEAWEMRKSSAMLAMNPPPGIAPRGCMDSTDEELPIADVVHMIQRSAVQEVLDFLTRDRPFDNYSVHFDYSWKAAFLRSGAFEAAFATMPNRIRFAS